MWKLARQDNLRGARIKCSHRRMPWDFWLIFLFLAVAIPWRGHARLKRLLAMQEVGERQKIRLYVVTIAFQWALTIVVAWRAFARGLTLRQLGLAHTDFTTLLGIGVAGAGILATLHWANLKRLGRSNLPAAESLRSLAVRLMPRTAAERVPYFCLAITAGICEEFVYRGFAMASLEQWGVPGVGTVFLIAILFGLAHAYQGKNGIFGTMVLGILFGFITLGTGSIFPVILWHAAMDIVAGIAGPKYLVRVSA